MDDPNIERSVQLRHRTCIYPNIKALEEDIAEYHASIVARCRSDQSWSPSEREQLLKDCDDYENMLDEYVVWSAEIENYRDHEDERLRAALANLPYPFGPPNA